MKNTKLFNLLISCPGDIKEELDHIKRAIENFNDLYADQGIIIRPRYWVNSAYPQSGGRPQSLLNKQFVEECDAAVALFWTRFGTPTDSYGSGTEEEIEIMLSTGKQVFLYFSEVPVSPSKIDQEQYKKVQAFKEKYVDRGIYWTYDSPQKFFELFTMHLPKFLIQHLTEEIEEQQRAPHLTVMGITAENKLTTYCTIDRFIPNTKERSADQLVKIRWLFSRISMLKPRKLVALSGAIGDLITSMRNTVEFDPEKKKIIIDTAEDLNIDIDDSFFEFGGLEKPSQLGIGPFTQPKLNGTKEEIEKYELLISLHTAIINYTSWHPFEESHTDLLCVKLALQNDGTTYAHDVEIRLRFRNADLVSHRSFPVLPYDTMQYICTDFSLDDIFGIPSCLNYVSYDDTLKPEPVPTQQSRDPSYILWGPDYKDEYIDELDGAFCYDLFTEGENTFVCLKMDILKHNSSAAFPTPIFVHDSLISIDYSVTAQELTIPVTGTIQVQK